jgi:hypothetical protein
MAVTVKQMAAWAQYVGATQSCGTYRALIECKNWEEVINHKQAFEFLNFFQKKMANVRLGVNWRTIHDIKVPPYPTLTLEEHYIKDLEMTQAERNRDDNAKAAELDFNIYNREHGTEDFIKNRENLRRREDAHTRANRNYEDAIHDIEESFVKKLRQKEVCIRSVLEIIPEFMSRADITHDVYGNVIAEPELCNPYDVYEDAEGL